MLNIWREINRLLFRQPSIFSRQTQHGIATVIFVLGTGVAHAQNQSLPLTGYLTCDKALTDLSGPFQPINRVQGPNQLYQQTSAARWELDDYGMIYRHSTLRLSVSQNIIVEEYIPSLDFGPSKMWIQTLQNLGSLPRDLNVLAAAPGPLRWSDVERTLNHQNLWEFTHPLRRPFLETQRLSYARAVESPFRFALSQYPRRKWCTPSFLIAAHETFEKTLRNASYLFLKDRVTGEPKASMRLVMVNNGLVRLTHERTGRILEVMGNSEYTWGVDGSFRPSLKTLVATHQLDRFVPLFLRSNDQLTKNSSEYDPQALIHLPMEGYGIELPRNWQMMDLTKFPEFGPHPTVQIAGEIFKIEYGVATLVEPGLFAIAKSEDRGQVFAEMSLWLGRYLSAPPLPIWMEAGRIGYWTYNDLPLYLLFGFHEDTTFTPFHKYGVKWVIYGANVPDIQSAVRKLAKERDDSERSQKLQEYLRQMAEGISP